MEHTQARNRRKKNAKNPETITGLESEESKNYFSSSEDKINDTETSHEGIDGENYEENLEHNFEDNMKLNRGYQIDSENDDNDHNDDSRPPPVPPPPNSKSNTQILMNKSIVECHDQLTMRKDNYAYFVTTNGTPCDDGSKTLEKRETLPKFKKLQKGIAKEIKKRNYCNFALLIEEETEYNLFETLNNMKSSNYSLYDLSQNLNLRSISFSKTSRINPIPWEEVKSIFNSMFSNSTMKIIFCNGITQYPTKEQRDHSIQEAHSLALRGHKGVTKTCSRIRQ